MKTPLGLLCVVISIVVVGAAVTHSDRATAATTKAQPKATASQQLLVTVWDNGATFGMRGQELPITKEEADGSALPALQKAGWRIVSVSMTEAADTMTKQHSALVLLEK